MNFERPSQESNEQKNPYLEMRDKYKDHASEVQKKTGEIQGAKWEIALYMIMERSGDNLELVNAMNDFLGALDQRSRYGREDEPLGKESVELITKFFREKSEELRNLIGNRSAINQK